MTLVNTFAESGSSISLGSITVNGIKVKVVVLQQSNSSPESDGIPGIFYRKLADVLALPLSIAYQQSLYQSSIPDWWRLANITPLCKGKDDKQVASSYRPISLTDVACKILERIVARAISTFWLTNNLIC